MLREIYDGTEQKLRRGWGTGPYLRTGPVPGRQIFRGGILKKSRLKYGMREKKRLSTREKFKGRSILKTMLVLSFLVTTLLALEGAEAIA